MAFLSAVAFLFYPSNGQAYLIIPVLQQAVEQCVQLVGTIRTHPHPVTAFAAYPVSLLDFRLLLEKFEKGLVLGA
ncbi:hypothetical protein D3C71_1899940 [compost metagenome]